MAGISRSTLPRRLGGTRTALNEAVRQAGIDPRRAAPARERAVAAAAELIAERGLGSATLDAVAVAAADCSLSSLHTIFDGREGLPAAASTATTRCPI
ncbi:TetR family transcriptional regulator [Nonomuraea turkmeniaca]|uniref:TetR family transcriptional regulator n=1 Tax=Nonomuraea turkmeniaca TaxID=103838 RepID=UPI001476F8CD|nr:TetR family transcriptional regulator [Nonomuraea turkmeniaca]